MKNRYRASLHVEQLEALTPPVDLFGVAPPLPEFGAALASATEGVEGSPARVRLTAWDPSPEELIGAGATVVKARRRLLADGSPSWVWKFSPDPARGAVTHIRVASPIDPDQPYEIGADVKGNWNPDTNVLRLRFFRGGVSNVQVQYEDGSTDLYAVSAGLSSALLAEAGPELERTRKVEFPVNAHLVAIEKPATAYVGLGRMVAAVKGAGQGAKIGRVADVAELGTAINAAYAANGNQPVHVVLVGWGRKVNGQVVFSVGQGRQLVPGQQLTAAGPDVAALVAAVGQGKVATLDLFGSYGGLGWDRPERDALIHKLADGLGCQVFGFTGILDPLPQTNRQAVEEFAAPLGSVLVTARPQ